MKDAKGKMVLTVIFSIILSVSICSVLSAQTSVSCVVGNELRNAVSAATSGDTFLVDGACIGMVKINPDQQDIAIDCQNTGSITMAAGAGFPVWIEGPRAIIQNCTIRGGIDAVAVLRGGTATLNHNTIQGASRFGINVAQQSWTTIINNTVSDNARHGISVFENGSANIGFAGRGDTTASPNIIQNNGENGISVAYSSSSAIVGNTISNNGKSGIGVAMVSIVTASGNEISGNTLSGIIVTGNSGVVLGNDTGTTIFDAPNTSNSLNTLYGVDCSVNAYVDGRRGTLNGKKGKIKTATGCVNGLIP